MAFTEEGLQRVIAGKFPDGNIRGRVGVQLIQVDGETAYFRFVILGLDDDAVLFEYDPMGLNAGQQTVLGAVGEGVEAEIPIRIQEP